MKTWPKSDLQEATSDLEIERQGHKTVAFVALPIYTHIPNLKDLTKIFFKLSRPKRKSLWWQLEHTESYVSPCESQIQKKYTENINNSVSVCSKETLGPLHNNTLAQYPYV